MSHEHGHSDYEHHPHVLPLKVYIGVWLGLMVLTVVTVAVSYIDLGGKFNIILAMAVAACKASLVALFFMHLKYDDRFNANIFLGAFGFLALLFIFTLADVPRRGEVDPLEAGTIEALPKSSVAAESGHGNDGHGAAADTSHGAAADTSHGAGDH